MGTKMKPKTHKKRNPYWRSLRHFKGKPIPSKKKELKRTQNKIKLRDYMWESTDTDDDV
jgi:hypothetical protein